MANTDDAALTKPGAGSAPGTDLLSSAGVAPASGFALAPGTERWSLAREEVRVALAQRLTVAFLGPASAGKDSAIRALFGVDFGEIDPIPGSTDQIRAVPLDASGQVVLVNAPGFGDLRGEVDEAARTMLVEADVVVYVINADGGAHHDDREFIAGLRAAGRPVVVCLNKIDLIRDRDRERFVEVTLSQLGVPPEDGFATAFDPLPVLSDVPMGTDAVTARLVRLLDEQGKSLIFAKYLRHRGAACEPIVQAAARKAAVAGAIPVPGADLAVVTALQVRMILDIATVYEQDMDRDVALLIAGEALAGAGRGFVRWATNALKAAGWIPGGQLGEIAASAIGATIAGASTYGVGRAAIAWMEQAKAGRTPNAGELREVFDRGAMYWRDGAAR